MTVPTRATPGEPMHTTTPRMGDIGEPVRRIEFEPLPEQTPATTPAPVTEPDREPVPA